MSYIYNSFLANDIEDYIEFKCSLGYTASSYDKFLHGFDTFCSERYPEAVSVTEQMVSSWIEKHSDENTNGHIRRMIAVKGFLDFMKLRKEETYSIPNGIIGKYEPYIPYLYSDDELDSFFLAADTLPVYPTAVNRELISPVIFRMLYCCGLRPQEPLRLKCSDVDFKEGVIYIADSKTHKDRVVAMSEDMWSLCMKYNVIMDSRIPQRTYFFQRPDGNTYGIMWLQQTFRACIRHANMSFATNGRHPRVYDWRHNFATRVIQKWLSQGLDVTVMLPRLSTYMGHTSLEDTAYYIHLLPEHLKKNHMNEWPGIPEVPAYGD